MTDPYLTMRRFLRCGWTEPDYLVIIISLIKSYISFHIIQHERALETFCKKLNLKNPFFFFQIEAPKSTLHIFVIKFLIQNLNKFTSKFFSLLRGG